ncbi:unnamed protein product [Rhizopus stolonifer]
MNFVFTLKEAFAFAPIQDREKVLESFNSTQDIRYFYGLVLLQKLYDEAMKQENPLAIREPTEFESELIRQMNRVLNKYNEHERETVQYHELKTRFNLLTYPIQVSESSEFISLALGLDLSKKQEESSVALLPSKLDNQLIDSEALIKDSLKDLNNLKLEYAAIPAYMDLLEKEKDLLSGEQLAVFVRKLLLHPTDHCPAALDLIVVLLKQMERTDNNAYVSYVNFTLRQLHQLLDVVPEIVCKQQDFVQTYLERLIPYPYYSGSVAIWDDDQGHLLNYLNQAQEFVGRLPEFYSPLKAAVRFHKLRNDIVRNEFHQEALIEYLAIYSGRLNDPSSTMSSRFSSVTQHASVEFPLFGKCDRSEHLEVLKEYLTGLAEQDKLTVTAEKLGAYEDYQMMVALLNRIRLTTRVTKIEGSLSDSTMSLAQETLLSFAPCSLYRGLKRKPEDDILLTVKTKNLTRLSIRVFQMNTETYWRLHPKGDLAKDINLDGLCPTWENDVVLDMESPLLIKHRDFVFGEKGLAPEVFTGRGLWVVEFVGDNHQCRAIVQKGFLRHITQKTTAGHLLKVVDEEGNTVEASKALYENQVYQADESHNILIPYLPIGHSARSENMILVSPKDGFCEPVFFYQKPEEYNLDALFHVNHEMIAFNKKATVVVVPKLTLQNMPYSSIKSATLRVECTNAHQTKSTAAMAISSFDGPISFDFSVPELLKQLDFTLEAKVKALDESIRTVSTQYSYPIETVDEQPTNICLKKNTNGQYLIYILGANGEPKPGKEIPLTFNHGLTSHSVSSTLQSNNEGIVELGDLSGIASLEHKGRIWKLASDKSITLLPSTICVEASKPFKISQENCLVYKIGYRENLLESVSKCVIRENGITTISGLTEGEYKIFLQSPKHTRWLSSEQDYIHCTVVNSQNNPKDTFWKNWVIGQRTSIQQNVPILQHPLDVLSYRCSEDAVDMKLTNWTPKTFAVVSASTFVPMAERSLLQRATKHCSISTLEIQQDTKTNTRSLFLDDKKMSEEYQYILNRARSEKWAGSNLAPPSLLIQPKENSVTTSKARNLKSETVMPRQSESDFSCRFGAPQLMRGMRLDNLSVQKGDHTCFAFLDHVSPVVVVPVNPASGHIMVDRKLLGEGSLLECIVISGEQTVYKEIPLGQDTIKYNDISQQRDQALVRSKATCTLFPNESIELDASEIEVVDTVEKLLATIRIVSPLGEDFYRHFESLKSWPDMDLQTKIKTYSEKAFHELNFWIKKVDPNFFKEIVHPSIKSKIRKDFMDLYLLDEDLSVYSKNMFAFEQLNIVEKVLLAKTQPQESLDVVSKKFKNSINEHQEDGQVSDAVFNAIFSGSLSENDDDMGFTLPINEVCASYVSEPKSSYWLTYGKGEAILQAEPARPMANFSERGSDNVRVSDGEQGHDFELEEAHEMLREKAKELQKQKNVKYNFIKSTTEWVETDYGTRPETLTVNQFWVDFLEHKDFFLSPNFIYSLNSEAELMWVMCLMDLPFTNQWSKSYDNTHKQTAIKAGDNSPLLIFYRKLSQVSSNNALLDSLVIREELFVHDKNVNVSSDECIKIDPQTSSLEPQTHYGCQLVLSNLSSKPVRCELTYQIPTGSVPLGSSSYRLSQSVYIQPYSTWSKISGTFYFPLPGTFGTVPATVSVEKQGRQSLTMTEPSSLSVVDRSKNKEYNATTALYWPTIASHGSNEDVLSFLTIHKRLDKINLNLIGWRMTDTGFARKVFDLLSYQRCFFSESLWKYGVYHQFTDIVRDLLHFRHDSLLIKVGQTFKSPLISTLNSKIVYDYFPLESARTHPLQSTKNEIPNNDFYARYDQFLDYLCEKTTTPSVADSLMLTQYLLLQNRIGEAQDIFSRIHLEEATEKHPIQTDYLHAYLKTRIRLSDQEQLLQLDFSPIKETVKKYQNFGIQKWRERFEELGKLVQELERGYSSAHSSSSINLHPLLEFDIDLVSQELVIQHANIKSVAIAYYEMNIEVMFSENPFMNEAVSHDAFKLIKPTSVECIELNEPRSQKRDEEDDFDIIGMAQVQSAHISRVPFKGGNKNMMVEVKADAFTSDAITTGQKLEKSCAYYSNNLSLHISESFGIVRVIDEKTKRPVVGAYVKVYARLKREKKVEFWKDGYTGLNGVFDYMSVTDGNALIGEHENDLRTLVDKRMDKLSILIMSKEGAVVKEVYPPLT